MTERDAYPDLTDDEYAMMLEEEAAFEQELSSAKAAYLEYKSRI